MEELSLVEILETIRRRWWIVVLAVLGTTGFAWHRQSQQVPIYTAEATVQKQSDGSQLGFLGVVGSQGREELAAQVEILRTPAVLDPVIDSLDLRVAVVGERWIPPETVLAEVEVEPSAPAETYAVRPAPPGFALVEIAGERVLDRGAPGEDLFGPGLRIRLREDLAADREFRIAVRSAGAVLQELRQDVGIELVSGTNLIRIEYAHPGSERAAAVVNAIAESYQAFSTRHGRESAARRRDFIESQLAEVSDSLSRAQRLLLDYQEASGVVDPEMEGRAAATLLMEAERSLRELRFREDVLERLVTSFRSGADQVESFQRLVALGDLMPAASSLYSRLRDLQTERERLTASRFGLTAQRPEVERLDSLISRTEAEIRNVTEESLDLVREQIRATEATIAGLRTDIGRIPSETSGYSRLRQRVDAVRGVHDLLVEKFYEAQIAEAEESGGVEIVNAAAVPLETQPIRHARVLIFALLIGAGLGAGGAVFVDSVDTRVRSRQEAEAITGLTTLATIPELEKDGGEDVVDEGTPLVSVLGGTMGGEAFRMLRTNLRFARVERPKVLMLTSGEPAVGKTTVATNLARLLTLQGERILLIDADLRQPTIHDTFGIPRSPGLTNLLVGDGSLPDIVRVSGIDETTRLEVLTAGDRSPNAAELLGSRAFSDLINRVRNEYDQVIVDAPPAMAVADTAIVAKQVDAVVLVAQLGFTDRRALAGAVKQIEQTKVPILGLVINRAKRGMFGEDGGKYGSYYYMYGAERSRNGGGPARRLMRRIARVLNKS